MGGHVPRVRHRRRSAPPLAHRHLFVRHHRRCDRPLVTSGRPAVRPSGYPPHSLGSLAPRSYIIHRPSFQSLSRCMATTTAADNPKTASKVIPTISTATTAHATYTRARSTNVCVSHFVYLLFSLFLSFVLSSSLRLRLADSTIRVTIGHRNTVGVLFFFSIFRKNETAALYRRSARNGPLWRAYYNNARPSSFLIFYFSSCICASHTPQRGQLGISSRTRHPNTLNMKLNESLVN